ncbi:MAG: hypothetical protein AMJ62_08925 [Myxococcales bacterium SG8_38]|nr:MAG: hypothetical protein AMJ62_08925 [Myxococcales bacterium SG8_38]
MAVLASVSEARVVHLRMAGYAFRSGAGGDGIPLIVARLAFRSGVTSSEAQTGVILASIGDLAPVGFVVTRRAFRAGKAALMRVLVAGHAVGVEPEKRLMAAAILPIVALLAPYRGMGAFERPAGQTVIEPGLPAARPAHEQSVSSEMLDVAATAWLVSILAAMKTGALADAGGEVVVARKTRVGVDSPSRGVALAAVCIPLEIGMVTAELARREELSAALSGPERSCERCDQHAAGQNCQGFAAAAHQEKIQRYP